MSVRKSERSTKNKIKFGSFIKEIRNDLGLTLDEVAKKLQETKYGRGTKQHLSNIEGGSGRGGSNELFEALGGVYGMPKLHIVFQCFMSLGEDEEMTADNKNMTLENFIIEYSKTHLLASPYQELKNDLIASVISLSKLLDTTLYLPPQWQEAISAYVKNFISVELLLQSKEAVTKNYLQHS